MTTYLIILGATLTVSTLVSLIKKCFDGDKELKDKNELEKWGVAFVMLIVFSLVLGVFGIGIFLLISEILIPIALLFTVNAILMIGVTVLGLGAPVLFSYRKQLTSSAKNLIQTKREKLLLEQE